MIAHPELVRHPFVDLTNAPDDEEEQRMYEVYRFMRSFDQGTWHNINGGGRKRTIPPTE